MHEEQEVNHDIQTDPVEDTFEQAVMTQELADVEVQDGNI